MIAILLKIILFEMKVKFLNLLEVILQKLKTNIQLLKIFQEMIILNIIINI